MKNTSKKNIEQVIIFFECIVLQFTNIKAFFVFFPLAMLNESFGKVSIEDFELLKVLGTGGVYLQPFL